MTLNIISANCTLKFGPVKGHVYPGTQDFRSLVPLTFTFLIVRYTLERFCFTPLGRWLQINDAKKRPVPYNDILEAAYRNKWNDLYLISKQLKISERQVQRWWRLRRNQDKPSALVKFSESLFRGTIVFFNFLQGVYTLWDKEWLWDVDKIDKDVHLGITSDIWWYYMISSAFYCSLTVTQFWDVRRKDFWQMFVHHLATVTLLSVSWLSNYYRMGSVIMLLHSADFMLDLGKSAQTARLRGIPVIFAIFLVTWVVTRLILFPYWILTKTTAQALACNDAVFHLLNCLLWVLMALHLVWTWMIFQIVHRTITLGQELSDVRSCSSESEESESKAKKL